MVTTCISVIIYINSSNHRNTNYWQFNNWSENIIAAYIIKFEKIIKYCSNKMKKNM